MSEDNKGFHSVEIDLNSKADDKKKVIEEEHQMPKRQNQNLYHSNIIYIYVMFILIC